MKLQNFQLLLAKIYTDAIFRQLFFENPTSFAKIYDISPKNLEILAQQYQQEIDLFSKTLINKRLYAIKNILPNTYHIFQEISKEKINEFQKNNFETTFEKIFEKYCQKYTLFSENRYIQDAFDFSNFLKENIFFGKNLSQLQQQIITQERLKLRTTSTFFRFFWTKNTFFLHIHLFKWYFFYEFKTTK